MEHKFWQERWETKNIGFNQPEPNKFLREYGLKLFGENKNVFVPLCGKSVDMLWFYENSFNVLGCELVGTACCEFFTENNIKCTTNPYDNFIAHTSEDNKITILEGDLFRITQEIIAEYNINAIYDRASLVALPKDMRKKYAEHIKNITKNRSIKYFLIVFEFGSPSGPPFSVPYEEIKELYSSDFAIKKIDEDVVKFKEGDTRKRILYFLEK